MADLAPLIRQRFFDANGEPLSGGKLWSYVAGTTTPIQTYTDRSGTSFNTNPIILDSEGYCDVWLGPGYFKFVLMDANDVTIWTKDNVSLTTNSNESLPSGGLANTFLKKNTEVDFDCGWVSLAKSDVGLGNVDNTSDANKPISTATQTALDLKADESALIDHISAGESLAHPALSISYDTSVTGLTSTNAQQAIDEVKNLMDSLDASDIDYSNATSGLTATDTQAAIDEVVADIAALDGDDIAYTNVASGLISNNVQDAIDEVNDIKVDKSFFVAKGDLLSATAASTPARLAVGSNGQVLTADSAESTGLKWASSLTNPMTTQGDLIVGGTSGATTRLAKGADGDIFKMVSGNPVWSTPTLPTIQKFTSGSGTYTTPSGVKYIKVELVGGGGGGAGSGTSGAGNGGAGGNTTFGTSLLSASGGGAGLTTNGGGGGAASLGSGPSGLAISGGSGQGDIQNGLGFFPVGGQGGSSAYGGGGGGGAPGVAGKAGSTNSGGGGGGGGAPLNGNSGGGGGAGGFVRALILGPSATYSYSVGASGTAGAAGASGFAGGAGGSGVIIVEEYYQ